MLNGDLIFYVYYKDANTTLLKIRDEQNRNLAYIFFFSLENYALSAFAASARNKKVQILFKLILLIFKWLYCYLQDFNLLFSQKSGGSSERGE